MICPKGKKLRSNVEIIRYLDANPYVKCDRNVTNTSTRVPSKICKNNLNNENKIQTEIIPTEISRDNNKRSEVALHHNYMDDHEKVLPNSKKSGFSLKVAEYLDWKKGKIRAVTDRQISKSDTNSTGDEPQKSQENEILITNSGSTNLENDQSKIDAQTSIIIDQNPFTKSIGDSKTQKTPNKVKKPEISKDSVDYLNWKKEQKKLAEIKKNVPNQTSGSETVNDSKISSDGIKQTPVKSKQTPAKSKQTPAKDKQTPAKKKDLFPYKCRQCTEAFASIDEIMKHCQTAHEEKKQEDETNNVNGNDNKEKQPNNVHEDDKQEQTEGQLISECPFDDLNFPKNQRKI